MPHGGYLIRQNTTVPVAEIRISHGIKLICERYSAIYIVASLHSQNFNNTASQSNLNCVWSLSAPWRLSVRPWTITIVNDRGPEFI